MAQIVSTDCVGAVIAALELAPRPVLVISPERIGQGANSVWALGGLAAAMNDADSPDAHVRDTIAARAGTVDEAVTHQVTRSARDLIFRLTEMSTPFDRDVLGRYLMNPVAITSARIIPKLTLAWRIGAT